MRVIAEARMYLTVEVDADQNRPPKTREAATAIIEGVKRRRFAELHRITPEHLICIVQAADGSHLWATSTADTFTDDPPVIDLPHPPAAPDVWETPVPVIPDAPVEPEPIPDPALPAESTMFKEARIRRERRLRQAPQKSRPPTDAEFQALLRVTGDAALRRLLVFVRIAQTGFPEACHAKWAKGNGIMVRSSKGSRLIQLPPCLLKLLAWIQRRLQRFPCSTPNHRYFVFVDRFYSPWNSKEVLKRLRELRERAGWPVREPAHAWRLIASAAHAQSAASFVTREVQAGVQAKPAAKRARWKMPDGDGVELRCKGSNAMGLFRVTSISYHRPNGRKCSKAEATGGGSRLLPGFKRKPKRSTNWYGSFRDHTGKPQRVPLCPDKEKSRQLLAKIVTEDRMIGADLTDTHADQRGRPLGEHVDDFVKYLTAKGNTESYVLATGQHIRAVAEGCKAAMIADLTPDRVMNFLAERRRLGMSASTSNHYLRSSQRLLRLAH